MATLATSLILFIAGFASYFIPAYGYFSAKYEQYAYASWGISVADGEIIYDYHHTIRPNDGPPLQTTKESGFRKTHRGFETPWTFTWTMSRYPSGGSEIYVNISLRFVACIGIIFAAMLFGYLTQPNSAANSFPVISSDKHGSQEKQS